MTDVDNNAEQFQEEKVAEKIQNVRLQKEFDYLKSINHPYELVNRNEVIFKDMLDNHQHLHLFIPKEYPFKEPLYSLSSNPDEKFPVSQVIEEWVPKIKIFELIELLAQRINQKQKVKADVDEHILLKGFHSNNTTYLIIVLAIVIRVIVALGPYSGQGDTPNYGDFEAHRNWMSITVNKQVSEWYDQPDPEPWWRIDYPPVAAYLSYLFGKTYQTIEPESMLLQRGYESDSLKIYMRLTALLVDIICLFPSVYLISTLFQRNFPQLFLLLLLIKPDSILIDHGHFQYNSLILGLILLSFYCLIKQYWYLTCFFFTIALHSKQMSFYYAFAFLAGIVGVTFNHFKYNRPKFFVEITKYAVIVAGVSIILWAPWFGSFDDLKSVVTAIFPVHRGLYQLKVPNFWCISDIVFNWESVFSKQTLVILCFLSSALLSLPSMFSMILNPCKKSLVLGFATISMTFFMFSYHVHEKSILLPLAMMPIVGEIVGGWLSHQLTLAGCFGMFHLLREDGQEFGYFGLIGLYFLFGTSYTLLREKYKEAKEEERTLEWHRKIYEKKIFRFLFVVVAITLHLVALTVDPPAGLPFLWNLLFAFVSFLFNCYFLLLGNLLHLQWIYTQLRSNEIKNH